MHDVFISYSSQNKNVADAICNRLESGDIRCWYAPRDIQAGKSWAGAIMKAIENTKVFLLIYSKNYNTSQQVLNELTAAVDTGCTIVPFRVDQTEMNDDLAYYLKKVHWLDAINPPTQKEIDTLYRHICAILGKQEQYASGQTDVSVQNHDHNTEKKQTGFAMWLRTKSGMICMAAVVLIMLILAAGQWNKAMKKTYEQAYKAGYEFSENRKRTIFDIVEDMSETHPIPKFNGVG